MNVSYSLQSSFSKSLSSLKSRKGIISILIFIVALVAFEAFNFSTTDFALSDLLGDLQFSGIRWATLLSIAFCSIDFAGIVRLFTPQSWKEESHKVWYMLGAWFIAATMNTILTWWGIVMAMQTHAMMSTGVMNSNFVTKTVPVFIALMVWIIRILLVGTLTKKGDQLLHDDVPQKSKLSRREFRQAQSRAAHTAQTFSAAPSKYQSVSPSKPKPGKQSPRSEPTYIPLQEDMMYHSWGTSNTSRR